MNIRKANSFLGPPLFNLYINELYYIGSGEIIVNFTDDTAIIYKNHSWVNLKIIVENDFPKFIKWFDTINTNKTFRIFFTSYSTYPPKFESLEVSVTGDSRENRIDIKTKVS